MFQIHDAPQGSQVWLALRAEYDTASESSAMMNISSYQTRDELMQAKKTGITPEIDAHTQKRFDRGHAIEAFARPLAEAFIDDELYPVTGSDVIDGLNLLASYDGLTVLRDIAWECKTMNAKLRAALSEGIIPDEYHPQMEQLIRLSGAERCLFTASDGTEEGTLHVWYHPSAALWSEIIAGWHQFNKDLIDFVPVLKEVKVVGRALMELPTLSITTAGGITSSNLEVFEKSAKTFLGDINTELSTDQEFADAETAAKACRSTVTNLDLVKKAVLGQIEDVDIATKTIDLLMEDFRLKALFLEKAVKTEKDNKKVKIVTDAKTVVQSHYDSLNAELDGINMTYIEPDFASAVKNKKTFTSMQSSVNDEIASTKIALNEQASLYRTNLAVFNAEPDYKMLFSDIAQIIEKAPDDFKLLVESRINKHKEEEKRKAQKIIDDKKIEDDRIAQEEEDARITPEQEEQSDDNKDNAGNEQPKQEERQEQAETKLNVDKPATDPVSNTKAQAATSATPQSITPKRAVANLIKASMEYGYKTALEDNGLELEDDSIGDFAEEMLSNAVEDGGMDLWINPVMELMNGASK